MDLNDFVECIVRGGMAVPADPGGLDPLFEDFAVNPVRPAGAGALDLLFPPTAPERPRCRRTARPARLHPPVARARRREPEPKVELLRRGLPYRVPLDPADPDRSIAHLSTRADRYPRVGWDRPKASDHCPLVVEIDLPETPPRSGRMK